LTNPTDYYDPAWLDFVRQSIQRPKAICDPPQTQENASDSILSMRDAIDIAQGDKMGGTAANGITMYDLTEQQKFIVAIIAMWRQTPGGIQKSDRLANEGYGMAIDIGTNFNGQHDPSLRLISLNFDNILNGGPNEVLRDLKTIMNHEYVHAEGYLRRLERGDPVYSSFDYRLYQLGEEGLAFVTQEVEYRKNEKTSPLTIEEKRQIFRERATDGYYYSHYGLNGTTRTDGPQMKLEDFIETYGRIEGEEGNFLEGLKSFDEIFLPPQDLLNSEISSSAINAAFKLASQTAKQVPIPYEALPAPVQGVRRFEGGDPNKTYIAYLKPGVDGSKATLDLFLNTGEPGKSGYVKIADNLKGKTDEHGVTSFWAYNARPDGKVFPALIMSLLPDGRVDNLGSWWDYDDKKCEFINADYNYLETTGAPPTAPKPAIFKP
jgi:hypothetical protein